MTTVVSLSPPPARVPDAADFIALAENLPHLAWMADAEGWIYWYNSQWYAYTGTTPEQMRGRGWQSVHDPEVLPSVLDRWQNAIATGEPFDMVFPLKGANGAFRPFLTRVRPSKMSTAGSHSGSALTPTSPNSGASPSALQKRRVISKLPTIRSRRSRLSLTLSGWFRPSRVPACA
jgi:PAS domain S-box-containing protein